MQKPFLILIILSSALIYGNDFDENGFLVIPKVENGSITLDAQHNEEAWSAVLTSELSDSTTIDDYYALFGLLHDDANFYLYFKITDDWLDYKKNDWNTDAVEIYVDGDDSKYDVWDNIDDYQVTVPLGAESVDEWAGVGPTEPYPRENIEYGVTETNDGWDTEVALPKDDFLFSEVIGFDLALNDADETEARENQIWFQDDGSWNIPSSWGSAIFSDVLVSVKAHVRNPASFELGQNYPNPFNPVTRIPFALQKRSEVNLSIYDLLGHKVVTLVDGIKDAGSYDVFFDASSLPSGIYYYQLQSSSENVIRKMVLMR